MMNPNTYQWCYEVLGADPHCDWQTLRTHYRRKLHASHPDLHSHDGEVERAGHEDEFKNVVHAFRLLARYYRHHGSLPMPSLPVPASVSRVRVPAAMQTATGTIQGQEDVPAGRTGLRLAPLAVGVFLLAVTAAAAANYLRETASPGDEASPVDGQVLSVGMTPTQVLDVQGVPTVTHGSVWFYGESGVIFQQGCVAGWEDFPPFPLHTLSSREHRDADKEAAQGRSLADC